MTRLTEEELHRPGRGYGARILLDSIGPSGKRLVTGYVSAEAEYAETHPAAIAHLVESDLGVIATAECQRRAAGGTP